MLGLLRQRQASWDAESGEFAFANVTSGSYVLSASALFNDVNFYAYREVAAAQKDIEELDLILAPGGVVSGRVHIESSGRRVSWWPTDYPSSERGSGTLTTGCYSGTLRR